MDKPMSATCTILALMAFMGFWLIWFHLIGPHLMGRLAGRTRGPRTYAKVGLAILLCFAGFATSTFVALCLLAEYVN